ncbi:hypothetical protein AMS68_000493 [Peltaster fructicola]|uniref:HhH-GPD domain-containing protein n=1 Tax=Peltaster fructicola TaxID=286661 RepID=A0A6H0XJT5_9PEZI|nr:hypothetical protein AMS68_000493 [Peltaster fructicola]
MARATRSSMAKAKEPQQLSSPPATPVERKPARKARSTPAIKKEDMVTPKSTTRKRTRASQAGNDEEDFPHGLDAPKELDSEPSKKRGRRSVKPDPGDAETEIKKETDLDEVKASPDADAEVKPTPKKLKKDTYGLTPGQTPYPDYPHPTAEECREVVRLLEKEHGTVNVPTAVPPPSLEVAGCGEVPSVLDALVRTRLSANTTNKNSSTAFQGLVKRFGVLEEGIGKGSVDWDAVRVAPQREVFLAIERGGLADRKSKDIQAILQIAYEEGQARKAALQDPDDDPAGAENEGDNEKKEEIEKASKNILSMDHLHLLSTEDAINRMLELPGIGPKTASCVALFCMRRPSFAVDTHVFRLCQWLGWVPKTTKKGQPKVDRNTTFSHCDVRIPDEFKYKLHYLLIRHGKDCQRCRAITGQSSAGWDAGCPIEHLVKRHGSKKGGISVVDRKKAKDAADGQDADSGADEE